MTPAVRLREIHACSDAVEWVEARTRPERLWQTCPRGDWLICLAVRLSVDRKLVVLAACDCVRTALVHVPAGEDRPRLAIEFAEAWTRGEATLAEVRAARHAARAAVIAAPNSYAAYASYATCYAVRHAAVHTSIDAAAAALRSTANAAAAALRSTANAAAGDAADAAAAVRAHAASLAHSADLVRARIPWTVVAARLTACDYIASNSTTTRPYRRT